MSRRAANAASLRYRFATLAAPCLLGLFLLPGTSSGQALESIEVDTDRSIPEIHINFTEPFRYVTHNPTDSASTINVLLQPTNTAGRSIVGLTGKEYLRWKPTPALPLIDVDMNADSASGFFLKLRFAIDVRVWMRPSADLRTLIVLVEPGRDSVEMPAADRDAAVQPTGLAVEKVTKVPVEPTTNVEDLPMGDTAALMELARQATAGGDYASAIRIYTKVLQGPPSEFQRDAREYLGVVRERNGQFAHAKAEYDTYLEEYAGSEGVERVQQRLTGLLTAADTPKAPLRESKRSAEEAIWDVFGSFSQYYRRNQSVIDSQNEIVSLSGVFNNADVNLRRRSRNYDTRARFTGDYIYSLLKNGVGDQSNVTALYYDIADLNRGLSLRAGRQTRRTGGVLGRFDGMLLGYDMSESVRLNAVAGFPVEDSSNGPRTDRSLYGISAELGTYAESWNFVPYFIEQKVDGILDRRAVGLETQYFDMQKTFVNYVDYDVSFNSLNNLYFFGNWTFDNRVSLNLTYDYRNNPVLSTYNALIGQQALSIDELLQALPEDEIRQLAEDRTSTSKTMSVGAAFPLSELWQFTGDVTGTEFSDTMASGGVEAVPGTDLEYYYSAQFIGSSITTAGDSLIVGLRYADGTVSRTSTLSLNARYPLRRTLRISPRLRIDRRMTDVNESSQLSFLPSIRIDYRRGRNMIFELEGGYEYNNTETTLTNQTMRTYFINLGYRAIF